MVLVMELFGQILKTTDYSLFSNLKGNRVISKPNLAKLAHSMQEKQLITPILVNERYEIIDGQHRFQVCKDYGLPVYFYVVHGYGVEEVKRCNTTGVNWNKSAFLQSYVDQEVDSYLKFSEIRSKYDVSINVMLKILANIQHTQPNQLSKKFDDGELKLDGENEKELIDFLDELEDFNFFKEYKTNLFVSAFLKLSNHPQYEHTKMLRRLATHKEKLKKSMTQDEYLSLLCNKIYSFGPTKNPIFYSSESKKFHQ